MKEIIKINNIVSMYKEPVFGTVSAEKRVMALAIDKESKNPILGLAREITRSRGSVDVPGFIDESKLIIVESLDGLKWKKVKDLEIEGIEEVIKKISGSDKYFIGLEDPDIWTDEKWVKHVYFTIAFKVLNKLDIYKIYLGHAFGKSLENLEATEAVLGPVGEEICGFKEACISPEINGKRINLNEMGIMDGENWVSAISFSEAKEMSKPWKYLGITLDPRKMKYDWCKGHLSPCKLLPREFVSVDFDKDLLVGIVNGREKEKIIDGKKIYGKFNPGLILFNPKTGEIPRISSEPLFEDPDARTITFASDFFISEKKGGILYAHVNDSFVRAYKINPDELKKLLPEKI